MSTTSLPQSRQRFPTLSLARVDFARVRPWLDRDWFIAALLMFGTAVAAQTWFSVGKVLASGDGFPIGMLNPDEYIRLGQLPWGYRLTSVGAPQYDGPVRMIPALFGWFGSAVGLGAAGAQRLFITALYAALAPSAFAFLRLVLPHRRYRNPSIAGAAFFSLSPALLFVIPNIVLMTSLFLIPLLCALMIWGVRSERSWRSATWFALATLPLSFSFVNPPSFALVLMSMAITVGALLFGPSRPRVFPFLWRAALLAVLVNLWWLVPVAVFVLSPTRPGVTPDADPFAWAWTHQRASIVNILRMLPNWGWAYPEYFPFKAAYQRPWMIALELVPAAVTLVLAAVTRGLARRIGIILAVSLVILVFFGKGLHPPLSGVSRWLYLHMPGLWLLREPAAKLGVFIAGVVTIGLVVAVGSIVHRRQRKLGVAGIAFLALALGFPIWTGQVTPRERPLLPSALVEIPGYWTDAADFLNAEGGTTLLLPPNDYYQLPYDWGYYGSDVIGDELINAPLVRLIEPRGNVYYEPAPAVLELQRYITTSLEREDWEEAARTMQVLGVRWVMVRGDVDAEWPDRFLTEPAELSAGLRSTSAFKLTKTFGPLEIFELAAYPGDATATTYISTTTAFTTDLVVQLATSDPAFATVKADDASKVSDVAAPVSGSDVTPRDGGGFTATIPSSVSPVRLFTRWPTGVRMGLAVENLPGRAERLTLVPPRLVNAEAEAAAGIPSVSVESRNGINFDGLALDGRRVGGAAATSQVLSVLPGRHRLEYLETVRQIPLVDPGFENVEPEVGDCFRHDKEPAGLQASLVSPGFDSDRALSLKAKRHSACVKQAVNGVSADKAYRLQFQYRHGSGSPPRICVWEYGPNRCASLEPLNPDKAWQSFDQIFRVDPRTTSVDLFLYADAGTTGSENFYDELRITEMESIDSADFNVPAGWVSAMELPANDTERTIDVEAIAAETTTVRPFAGSSLEVLNCHAVKGRKSTIGGKAIDRGVRLEAESGLACVNESLGTFDPQGLYELKLQSRRATGEPPTVCVWQVGPNRCAKLETSPSPNTGWRDYKVRFSAEPGTTDLRLYLYADGGPRRTVAEFRDINVRSVPQRPDLATLTATSKPPAPRVEVIEDTTTRYRLRIHNAQSTFLLSLNRTFDPQWKISGAGRHQHMEVNGFANGWLMERKGTYDVVIEYSPIRYVRGAQFVSVTTLLVAVGALIITSGGLWVRRRRQ